MGRPGCICECDIVSNCPLITFRQRWAIIYESFNQDSFFATNFYIAVHSDHLYASLSLYLFCSLLFIRRKLVAYVRPFDLKTKVDHDEYYMYRYLRLSHRHAVTSPAMTPDRKFLYWRRIRSRVRMCIDVNFIICIKICRSTFPLGKHLTNRYQPPFTLK